ncbi:MAG TPA: PilX N-terminal domain-containing pilus assembly protein [Burkholderiales bacterium]|nr:PilX N-terminal domain-containing pilus assembly protein [Burkholderiales bacterium]
MKTMMMQQNLHSRSHQRGAVLVVGLIMLAVMTLFVISMLKTSSIELKIGGVSHIQAINFSNAELAINKFIVDNNGRFAPGFLGLAQGAPGAQINSPPANLLYAGDQVAIQATQTACEPYQCPPQYQCMVGSQTWDAAQFDVQATATGAIGGTTIVHTGVQTLAPAGSC